jgi:hypothetical protein
MSGGVVSVRRKILFQVLPSRSRFADGFPSIPTQCEVFPEVLSSNSLAEDDFTVQHNIRFPAVLESRDCSVNNAR